MTWSELVTFRLWRYLSERESNTPQCTRPSDAPWWRNRREGKSEGESHDARRRRSQGCWLWEHAGTLPLPPEYSISILSIKLTLLQNLHGPQSYLKGFWGEVRYKVLKEKACNTLLTEFFTHSKAQDVCHLQKQKEPIEKRVKDEELKTLVPRLKQLAKMVLSSFASWIEQNIESQWKCEIPTWPSSFVSATMMPTILPCSVAANE